MEANNSSTGEKSISKVSSWLAQARASRKYFDSAEYALTGVIQGNPPPKIFKPSLHTKTTEQGNKETAKHQVEKPAGRMYFDSADYSLYGISDHPHKYFA
eukprot:TRINITY_DN28888_c0_g1_i1.p1 TRINITY_DN28888_c0_g1~~TRINITY_DN28888_c0_g1_i1.p1  ORF type:complete len:100 (-),score=18.52 TRINITY_DN28888_c0_g1_i1:69-368(-)